MKTALQNSLAVAMVAASIVTASQVGGIIHPSSHARSHVGSVDTSSFYSSDLRELDSADMATLASAGVDVEPQQPTSLGARQRSRSAASVEADRQAARAAAVAGFNFVKADNLEAQSFASVSVPGQPGFGHRKLWVVLLKSVNQPYYGGDGNGSSPATMVVLVEPNAKSYLYAKSF